MTVSAVSPPDRPDRRHGRSGRVAAGCEIAALMNPPAESAVGDGSRRSSFQIISPQKTSDWVGGAVNTYGENPRNGGSKGEMVAIPKVAIRADAGAQGKWGQHDSCTRAIRMVTSGATVAAPPAVRRRGRGRGRGKKTAMSRMASRMGRRRENEGLMTVAQRTSGNWLRGVKCFSAFPPLV
jgi:hypothetical protein